MGAGVAVSDLVEAGDALTPATLGTTAATGAAMALVAWGQRRIEDYRNRRRGETEQ